MKPGSFAGWVFFFCVCSLIILATWIRSAEKSPSESAPPTSETRTPSRTNSPTATFDWASLKATKLHPTPDNPTIAAMETTQIAWLNNNAKIWLARGVICDKGYRKSLFINEKDPLDNPEWTVFSCYPANHDPFIPTPKTNPAYLKVIKTDFSKSWVIPYADLTQSINSNLEMEAEAWSKDGKYVYIAPHTYMSGCGLGPMIGNFSDGYVLFRIDLETGKWETVLDRTISYSFSPDSNYLVYSKWTEPAEIGVMNLVTREIGFIHLEKDVAVSGNFAWTDDGTPRLLFTYGFSYPGDKSADIVSSTSVGILDTSRLSYQIILHRDPLLYFITPQYSRENRTNVVNPSAVMLTSMKNWYFDTHHPDLTYNLHTGKFTVIPNPTPFIEKTPSPR